MCTALAVTAEAIYSVVNGKLAELLNTDNLWKLCTSVGVDNISVNIGIHNSPLTTPPLMPTAPNTTQSTTTEVVTTIFSKLIKSQ